MQPALESKKPEGTERIRQFPPAAYWLPPTAYWLLLTAFGLLPTGYWLILRDR